MKIQFYTMIYKIKSNKNKLRILGDEFIENNFNKGTLIINNKKSVLKNEISIKNMKKKELKIKMLLKENLQNRNYMFKNCQYLLSLSINKDNEYENSNKYIDVYGDNNNNIEYEEKEIMLYNFFNSFININNEFNYFLSEKFNSFIDISEIKIRSRKAKKTKYNLYLLFFY